MGFFAQGLFSISKSDVPFTAIRSDHGIEKNRAMKVLGGIKGISNSNQGLEKYFLNAPESGKILILRVNISKLTMKTEEHYQLAGSKNA